MALLSCLPQGTPGKSSVWDAQRPCRVSPSSSAPQTIRRRLTLCRALVKDVTSLTDSVFTKPARGSHSFRRAESERGGKFTLEKPGKCRQVVKVNIDSHNSC